MKKALLILVPSLLICSIFIALKHFSKDKSYRLKIGKTYEVWLKEAEVSAYDRSGEPWDSDGSAPDLRGMMIWQDQVVLQTVVASDGLIARWSDTAISASQAIKGEADTQSLQRVGRFRMDAEGSIEICIFDNDLVSNSFAGGFLIPLSSLRLGNNCLSGNGALKTLNFCIRSCDSIENDNTSQSDWMLTTDVKELNDPSAAMKSASDKLLQDVDNALYQSVEKIAEELKNQGEELGKELEDGLKDIINEMNIK
jgi:hypothetical protein